MEEKEITQIVPQNQLVPQDHLTPEDALLVDYDRLYSVAVHAEKRIEAVKKIKTMALKITNHHDWIDQGGKPYLQASGAEKIARLFGISWRFKGDIVRKDEKDGHFSFEVPMEFIMQNISIEFRGSRSSRDPFFSKRHGQEIPPSEIDKVDVMKAAITNAIGNGITRLLGIRNFTWEDLKNAGIDISKIGRIEYKSKKFQQTDDFLGQPETEFIPKSPPKKDENAQFSPSMNENITERQKNAIKSLMNSIGWNEEKLFDKIFKIIGKPIESLDSLTKGQAVQVIEALQKERDKKGQGELL